jgi:hypothetical protein
MGSGDHHDSMDQHFFYGVARMGRCRILAHLHFIRDGLRISPVMLEIPKAIAESSSANH